jgi:anti-sigma B factor antagonist
LYEAGGLSDSFEPSRSRGSGLNIEQVWLDERTVVVAVGGDLDQWSAPHLKRTLSELVNSTGPRLVLDFTRVGFMDSTAVGVLIGIQRGLPDDQRLAVAASGAEVLRVFELSGTESWFRVFANRDAALRYVTEGDGRSQARRSPPLTSDAALMLGIASTAMPFAQSAEDQAERWLRALRNHGEAGTVLASLGLSEGAVVPPFDDERPFASPGGSDSVATVTDRASQIAAHRGAPKLGTTDILLAVIEVYGATFYRVLANHGVDPAELSARVVSSDGEPADR